MVKKALAHVGTVIKGMLFIGFTVQILLGLAWMCRNFGQVQNFGEPGSALYQGLFRLLGEIPQLMYLLQLGAAFLAGDFFLRSFSGIFSGGFSWKEGSRNGRERFWSLWRALALLTYPFAMQCHMAVLPHSFMGSLFLMMLSFLIRLFTRRRISLRRDPAAKTTGAAMGVDAETGETAIGMAAKAGKTAVGMTEKTGKTSTGMEAETGETDIGMAAKAGKTAAGMTAKTGKTSTGMEAETGETDIGMAAKAGKTAVGMTAKTGKTSTGMAAKAGKTAIGMAETRKAAGRMAADTEGLAGGNKRRWQIMAQLALAVVCAGMFTLLSGALDASGRGEPGHGIEAAMASRFAWPTIWYDQGSWTDELREAVEDVLWEVSYYPENMALFQATLEERAGAEAAEAYNREIAEVAWRNHAPMIIRQMGWDILGYAVTPVIFQLQLQGEAYDSYTGRNYEIMRGNAPVLTRNYVNYGCWWFAAAFLLSLLSLPTMKKAVPMKTGAPEKKAVPMKTAVPEKKALSAEAATPMKEASPAEAAALMKEASPARATAPMKEASPAEAAAPEKEASPAEAAAPMKEASPAKGAALMKEASPAKAAAPMKKAPPTGAHELSGIGKRLAAMAGSAVICIVCSGILVGMLTMRGAGLMDYKYTALISQLWILPALFLAEEKPAA